MPESESPSHGAMSPRKQRGMCAKCGSPGLRPVERLLPDMMIGRHRYKCTRCFTNTSKFKPGLVVLLELFLLVAIGGGGFYVIRHPFGLRGGDGGGPSDETEALARARSAMSGGQLSAFEKMMTRRPRGTLDNKAVIQLWRAQVGVNIILQMIRTSNADYDVSANAVIELRKEGLDASIILAMIDASYTGR